HGIGSLTVRRRRGGPGTRAHSSAAPLPPLPSPPLPTLAFLQVAPTPGNPSSVLQRQPRPAQHHKKQHNTTKKGGRGRYRAPLPIAHVSPGRSQNPGTGFPTCVGKTLGELSQTCWELVHPHVRGADAHEPSGAALQYTTRRRGFPQLWGYGAQPPSSTPSTRLPFPELFHA